MEHINTIVDLTDANVVYAGGVYPYPGVPITDWK